MASAEYGADGAHYLETLWPGVWTECIVYQTLSDVFGIDSAGAIPATMANVTTVNLFQLARSLAYATSLSVNPNNDTVNFLSYNDSFTTDILGPSVAVTLAAEESWNAFHEAGVYYKETNSAYISSNFGGLPYEENRINVTAYSFTDGSITSTRYPNLAAANGATLFIAPEGSSPDTNGLEPNKRYVLWCDEGDFESPSGLVALDPVSGDNIPILTSYQGRNFSSANDVKQNEETGDLWFTDAQYGYFQNFRPDPVIPSQVYRFDPTTGIVQTVADQFTQANGIEFSPDFKTLYIADSGAAGFGDLNSSRTNNIYAFDVCDGKTLSNRRVFATPDGGIPDGIHTDTQGNVYASVAGADGLHVWNPDGVLLGKFLVEGGEDGGTNNFEFIPGGMLLFNAFKMWRIDLQAEGREVRKEWGPS